VENLKAKKTIVEVIWKKLTNMNTAQ